MDVSSGPENVLAVQLRNLTHLMVDEALRDVKLKTFKKCFPAELTKDRNNPTLKKLHERMVEYIKAATKSEFGVICSERQLVQKLNTLNQIISEQPILQNGQRCPTEPPQTTVDKLYERILALKMEERDRLRQIVASLEKENATTKQQITQLETEAAVLAQDITQNADITNVITASTECIEIKNSI